MQAPFRAALERGARVARAEADKQSALAEAAARRDVEHAAIEAEARVRARRAEVARVEAEEEIAAHELMVRARELALARERIGWQAEDERRRARAEVDALVGRGEAEVALARARAEVEAAAARARVVTAERLPELAGAVGARFGEVKVTHIGGGGDGAFGSIAQAVAGVLELARRA